MSLGPGQPEPPAALIEGANQLAVDRAIVPDLRYRENNLGRDRGHAAIVHGGDPTPFWPVRRYRRPPPLRLPEIPHLRGPVGGLAAHSSPGKSEARQSGMRA